MKLIPSICIIIGGLILTVGHIARHTLPIGSVLITTAGVGFLIVRIKERKKGSNE